MINQTVLGDNPTTTEKKDNAQKKEKSKGKVSTDQGELAQNPTVQVGFDEEIVKEELDAYIEEGENAGESSLSTKMSPCVKICLQTI